MNDKCSSVVMVHDFVVFSHLFMHLIRFHYKVFHLIIEIIFCQH